MYYGTPSFTMYNVNILLASERFQVKFLTERRSMYEFDFADAWPKKTFLNYIIGDQVVIKACCDRRSFYVPILNVNISYNNLFWSFINGSERIQNKIFKVFIPEHCGASCARRRGCVVGRAQPQRCPQGSGCYPRGLWNQGIQT